MKASNLPTNSELRKIHLFGWFLAIVEVANGCTHRFLSGLETMEEVVAYIEKEYGEAGIIDYVIISPE